MSINLSPDMVKTFTDSGITPEMLKQHTDDQRTAGFSDDEIYTNLKREAVGLGWQEEKPMVSFPAIEEGQKLEDNSILSASEDGISQSLPGTDSDGMPDWNPQPGESQLDAAIRAQYDPETAERMIADNKLSTREKLRRDSREFRNLERAGAFFGSMASSGTLGTMDLSMTDREASEFKETKESHPGYSVAGTITSYLTPGSWMNLAAKGSAALATKIGLKSGIGMLGKWGLIATGTEGIAIAEQTARRLAGTEEWNNELYSASNIVGNMALNVGIQAVLHTPNVVKNIWATKQKAIRALGGEENIVAAKQAYDEALKSGVSPKIANDVFLAKITENMEPKQIKDLHLAIDKDKKFATFLQQQLSNSKQVVIDEVNATTKKELGKLSNTMLESIYKSPESKQALGSSEVDLSAKSIGQWLGSDSQKFIKYRGEGLAEAEARVMNNAELSNSVRQNFLKLADDVKTFGSKDLTKAAKMIEPGTIKSFEQSGAMQQAMQQAYDAIKAAQSVAQKNGVKFTTADAQKIKLETVRNEAENYFRNLMENGTDSVQDINDIKTFFAEAFEQEIREGRATALGAFNEGVNTGILDKLSNKLFDANQAVRARKPLESAWEVGNKAVDKFDLVAFDNSLSDTTSLINATAKVSAFKQGFLAKYAESAIKGDSASLKKMNAMIGSSQSVGKYFTPEEFNSLYKIAINDKVVAARNLDNLISKTTNRLASDKETEELAKAAMYGAIQAPAAFLTSVWKSGVGRYYGPKTRALIQDVLEHKSWDKFNKLLRETTDLTEKQKLNNEILKGITEYLSKPGSSYGVQAKSGISNALTQDAGIEGLQDIRNEI